MIANKSQAVKINLLMLPLIASIGSLYRDDEDDLGMLNVCVEDVVCNAIALKEFNKDLNIKWLYASLMDQDTLPREHFSEVITYLESLMSRQAGIG